MGKKFNAFSIFFTIVGVVGGAGNFGFFKNISWKTLEKLRGEIGREKWGKILRVFQNDGNKIPATPMNFHGDFHDISRFFINLIEIVKVKKDLKESERKKI